MGTELVNRGQVHSATYIRALDTLDEITYRYELFVGTETDKAVNGDEAAMLLFWRKGVRYRVVEKAPTLPEVLNLIGARVLKWAEARHRGTDTEEWADRDRSK